MRIKDFTDTIRHLTDSFNIPQARRMIAENPALSREQFAEGQLVQPGPGRPGYGGKRKTPKEIAQFKKMRAAGATGEAIFKKTGISIPHQTVLRKKHKLPLTHTKSAIQTVLNKIPVGSSISAVKVAKDAGLKDPGDVRNHPLIKKRKLKLVYQAGADFDYETFLDDDDFKQLFKENPMSDREFAQFLKDNDYTTVSGKEWSRGSVTERRGNLKLKTPLYFDTRIPNTPKEVKKYAKENMPDLYKQYKAGKIDLESLKSKVQTKRYYTKKRTEMTPQEHEKFLKRARKYHADLPESKKAELKEKSHLRRTEEAAELGRKPIPRPKHWTKDAIWMDLVETARKNQGKVLNDTHMTTRYKNPKQIKRKWGNLDDTLKIKLVDNATGTTLTYDNFEKFIDTNKPGGMTFKEMGNQYEIKKFINENPKVKYALQEVIWPGEKPANFKIPGHMHHLAGRVNNTYKVSFAPASANLAERDLKRTFNAMWNQSQQIKGTNPSKAFEFQMKAVRDYKTGIEKLGNIQGQVGKKVVYGQQMDPKKWMLSLVKDKSLRKEIMKYCPKNKGGLPGECSIDDALEGFKREGKDFNQLDEVRKERFVKTGTNFLKAGKNLARATGIGAAWEAVFAPLMTAWMLPKGESWPRIFNTMAYGLPLVGETEKGELKRHMGETGFNVDQLINLYGDAEEISDWDPSGRSIEYTPGERDYLQMELNAEINRSANVPGKSNKQRLIEREIQKLDEKARPLIESFYEGPAGQYWGEEKWRGGKEARAEGEASLEEAKAGRLKKYQEEGWVAKPGWEKNFRRNRMGGGIMGLKNEKPNISQKYEAC